MAEQDRGSARPTGGASEPIEIDNLVDLGRRVPAAAGAISGDVRRALDPRALTGALNLDGSGASSDRTDRPPMSLTPGQLVPGTRYRVIDWLGEGGMGVVYEAAHIDIERRVALKILHADKRNQDEALRKFREEARLASKLGSDHVVEVYDLVELDDGRLMIAMELLRGRMLSDELAGGSMAIPRVIAILRQVCKALAAAHHHGIVHRDIKPDNIALVERRDRADFVKLLDFGIAGVLADRRRAEGEDTTGTPSYVAPETVGAVIAGRKPPIDQRVDIYAVGCTAYEALTGHPPFGGDTVKEIIDGHLNKTPVKFALAGHPEIPEKLEEVVRRCLAKDPAQRFANAPALEAALCEAQIDAGLRTEWDDLPLPDVDPAYRAKLHRAMPDPRGPIDDFSGPTPVLTATRRREAPAEPVPAPPTFGSMSPADDDEPSARGSRVAVGLAAAIAAATVAWAGYTLSSRPAPAPETTATATLATRTSPDGGDPSPPAPPVSNDDVILVEDPPPPPAAEPAAPEHEPNEPTAERTTRSGRKPGPPRTERARPAATPRPAPEPPSPTVTTPTSAQLIDEAARAKKAGNHAEAARLLTKALERDPRNTIAMSRLSDMAFDQARFEDAADWAAKAVAIAPGNARLRLRLGDAHYKLGHREEARTQYEQAAELGSREAQARLARLADKEG